MELNTVKFVGWDRFVVVAAKKLGMQYYLVIQTNRWDIPVILGSFMSETSALRFGERCVRQAEDDLQIGWRVR